MKWFIYAPLMLLFKIFCYLTNPIAVLFANEVGEIKGPFRYWKTWDDTLDSKFMMTEVVPEKYPSLDYGWSDKYEFYQDTETLKEYGYAIDKVRLKPGATFTAKEKLKRYFCRLLWIYRNCGYGFAFYALGADGYLTNLKCVANKNDGQVGEFVFYYDRTKSIFTRPWTLRFYQHVFGSIYITGYLGWKIPLWHTENRFHCMIAHRIVPRLTADDH